MFLVLSDQKTQLKCLLETIDKWDQKLVRSYSKISVFFLNMHQEVGSKEPKLICFQGFYLLWYKFFRQTQNFIRVPGLKPLAEAHDFL